LDKKSARKRILEPISDEQAERELRLVTSDQIENALREARRDFQQVETYARSSGRNPAVRYS